MNDQELPVSETTSTNNEPSSTSTPSTDRLQDLNKLLLDAVMAGTINAGDIHPIVINLWCAAIAKDIPITDRQKKFNDQDCTIAIKDGIPLLDLLYGAIREVILGRIMDVRQLPEDLENRIAVINISLQFVVKNTDLRDPVVLEWSFKTDAPWVDLRHYASYIDSPKITLDVAYSWVYLYEQTMQDKKKFQREKSQSREYYIKKILESKEPHSIKTVLEGGYCIGCGRRRDNQPGYSNRYCSLECSTRLDESFKVWKEQELSSPHLLWAALTQIAKILRNKQDTSRCKSCGKIIDHPRLGARHCLACMEKPKKRTSNIKVQN